jgi:hypothetical protein
MNIPYGVQATGNGHIRRSREIIRNLKKLGHKATSILSGREPSRLLGMEDFTMKTLDGNIIPQFIKIFERSLFSFPFIG